ncbi:hypothetical protein ACFLU1_05870 [Chloroflexota bacterium]
MTSRDYVGITSEDKPDSPGESGKSTRNLATTFLQLNRNILRGIKTGITSACA